MHCPQRGWVMMCLWLLCNVAFAQEGQRTVGVIIQQVQHQQLSSKIEALGSLRANESVRLTSNVTKTVTAINFKDGQRVHQGEILVEMTRGEEQALVAEARYTAEEAKKQMDRVKTLVASSAAAQSLLDQRVREYEAAQARYAALESRLQDLRITAPFSGVVGLRTISVGALVSPGEVITILNDDSQMKLDFTVPAIFLQSLRIGLPILATSQDLDNRQFEGQIYSIDNQIDPVTRAITVRAILPNDGRELRQGMLMLVELYADHRKALVVPEAALVPMGSTNFVFLARQKQSSWVVERQEVKIGQRLQGFVEVISGIDQDDKVVIHGLQKIRSGQTVTIIAERKDQESLADLLKPAES